MDLRVTDNNQKVTTYTSQITILPVPPIVEDMPTTLEDAVEGTAIVISPHFFTLSATSFNVRLDGGDGVVEDLRKRMAAVDYLLPMVVATYIH